MSNCCFTGVCGGDGRSCVAVITFGMSVTGNATIEQLTDPTNPVNARLIAAIVQQVSTMLNVQPSDVKVSVTGARMRRNLLDASLVLTVEVTQRNSNESLVQEVVAKQVSRSVYRRTGNQAIIELYSLLHIYS